MQEERIVETMMRFGLSKYEAKAYVSLSKKNEITAYELSKISGVPQGKIYETMNRLLEKNLVNIVGDNPIRYIPVALDGYLDSYQNDVKESIGFLKTNMDKMKEHQKVSFLWHIEGKENLFLKIQSMLEKVEHSVYLEAWNYDFEYFAKTFHELQEKGIDIVSVIYGKTDEKIGKIYYHEMEHMEEEVKELGRWFTIVIDGQESLFAVLKENGKEQGIWTENRAFMLMAESFIAHDIFIAEIYRKFRAELDREFGSNMEHIRGFIKSKI